MEPVTLFNKVDQKIFLSLHPVELKLLGKSVEEIINIISELNYGIYEIDGSKVNNYKLAEYLLLPYKEKNNDIQ